MKTKLLAEVLIAKFSSWYCDGSKELLSDGGTVIDHLVDEGLDRRYLKSIPESTWDDAWDIFNRKMNS